MLIVFQLLKNVLIKFFSGKNKLLTLLTTRHRLLYDFFNY